MTVRELYARAILRHKKLADGRFTIGMFKRWLDKRVEAGWLEHRDGRYYLTDEGLSVASQLEGELIRVRNSDERGIPSLGMALSPSTNGDGAHA